MAAPTDPPPQSTTQGWTPPADHAPQQNATGSRNARVLTIIGFVLAGLAVLFVPIVLGPVGAVLGGIAMKQGDPLGRWALIAGIAGTIIGMVLGALVFSAATS